jgi:flagellar protein FliO/FliZ
VVVVNKSDISFTRVGFAALVYFGASGAATGATAAPDPMAAGSLFQLLFGLIVVLIAIGVTALLLRRLGRLPQGAGAMRVIAGLSLGARERAVLIQVGDKQILLGVAPGRVQALHVLERPVDTGTAGPGMAGGFAERLAQLMKGGRA